MERHIRSLNLAAIVCGLIALVGTALIATPVFADDSKLPRRISPVPSTTNSVPHVQIGVVPNPELSAELLRRAGQIPGVEVRETVISLPGAKGFWINESVKIGRPEVIVGGREFAHMHPDGSLHASLSPEHAIEAVKSGWATFHPWSSQRPGWEGFVMIYTPVSKGELDVVVQLILRSYAYVVGES